MSDLLLFVAFPYAAVIVAVIAGVYRFYSDRFSYSALSSQFLESKDLFWGSGPLHYGIITILLAHVFALIFPGAWAALISTPLRLYIVETIGLALALLTIVGLLMLILRRILDPRIKAVTSPMDWILLVVLMGQVGLGLAVAFFYRWGSGWYLYTAVPWLISLIKLDPQVQFVTTLPLVVKLHMLGGFFIIALFPFTRLVHLLSFPITYLWRPYQVVIWNRRTRSGREKSKK
jgi:nitrate reductase gamma subunit